MTAVFDSPSVLPGLAWPPFPGPSAANKLALLFRFEENQWRSPDDILRSQFDQLRQLVAFARETVPYFRRQFSGLPAARSLTPESWLEIPPLTRKTVHAQAAELRSERPPAEHGTPFPISTSGSTGMVVEVLGTALTALFWQVCCLRDHRWHRRDLGAKLFAIRYLRNAAEKGPLGVAAPGWGPATDDVAVTGPSISYDILLELSHLAERLRDENPGYLLGHPSVVRGLAWHCLDRGIGVPGLREVRTLGESCEDDLEPLCRQAWGSPVVDLYSCQEAGYLALRCPDFPHYHVQSENVLLEIVDDQGRPCAPGEVGRVLVTSLNNFATPLIRYEIGDLAEVGPPCPCGRGLPVITRIMGRTRNLLVLPDGTRHWPRLGYESRLQEVAPIDLMQMEQIARDEIVVRLVMPRPLTETEQQALTAFIHDKLRHPFRLRFDYVDSIRNPRNGKIEQFISRLAETG